MRRRRFVSLVTRASVGLCAAAARPESAAEPRKVPVCVAPSGSLRRRGDDVSPEKAQALLDHALQELTGQDSAPGAWASLFHPDWKVALKLSCLPGPRLSTTPGVVRAVIAGLISAGVAPGSILIWERSRTEMEKAGFKGDFGGARIVGTDEMEGGGYSDDILMAGSVASCFSRMLQRVDAIINLPVVKHHDLAGLSAGMKNFYGAIHNPNKYHNGRCNPYVADLCNHPLIRGKLRLVVADTSRVQAHNGPGYYPAYAVEWGGMVVGCDPVAVDRQAWSILDEARLSLGLNPLAVDRLEPTYLATAARLGLGLADESRIRRVAL
jgi:uncharacterized protein (DUF362 family)